MPSAAPVSITASPRVAAPNSASSSASMSRGSNSTGSPFSATCSPRRPAPRPATRLVGAVIEHPSLPCSHSENTCGDTYEPVSTPSAPDANVERRHADVVDLGVGVHVRKRPVVRATGPSGYASVSAWWMPRRMSRPPGLRARCARQAVGGGLPGSEKQASASTTVPSSPTSSLACRAEAPEGVADHQQHAGLGQASQIRSAASTVSAIGFSTNTCRPASGRAIAFSAWTWLGVAMSTPSASSVASTS